MIADERAEGYARRLRGLVYGRARKSEHSHG